MKTLTPPHLKVYYLAMLCLLTFLPIKAGTPECSPVCPTVPYDVVFKNLIHNPCGTFTLDIGVEADDFPLEDVLGISFEIIISNYQDFELDLASTEASMNTLFEERGLEVDYNAGTGQMFLSQNFGLDPIESLDATSPESYARIVKLHFSVTAGASSTISYGTNPTLYLDFNDDGIPDSCLPDNVSSPVLASVPGYTISGEFETMNTQNYSCGELEDVFIEFSDTGGVLCDDVSDSGGEYASCGLCAGGTYRASPVSGPLSDTLCGGAIDTSDLAAIKNHLLGTVPFSEVWQYFAADCNGSLHVSAADLSVVQKAILHISVPQLVPWTYWTKASIDAITLPHIDPISAGEQYWEFSNLSEDKTMRDFYGVRTMQVHLNGQPCNCVNNVADTPEARGRDGENISYFGIEDRMIMPGEVVPVTLAHLRGGRLYGFDISLRFSNGLLVQQLSTHTEFDPQYIAETYKIDNGGRQVRLMFDHVDREKLQRPHGGDLITLMVKHQGEKPYLLSEMIAIEPTKDSNYIRYDQNKPYQLGLVFRERNAGDIQIVPNPLTSTFVYYSESDWESMTLMSMSGKAIFSWSTPEAGQMYPMEGIPAGIYILRFAGRHGTKSVRIVKR